MQRPSEDRAEDRAESSEEFEIVLNDEEDAPEERDLLSTYAIDPDTVADKPWNKPGEDITDYFNYGFTETTWKEYTNKQKRLREEYGSKGRKKERSRWAGMRQRRR